MSFYWKPYENLLTLDAIGGGISGGGGVNGGNGSMDGWLRTTPLFVNWWR